MIEVREQFVKLVGIGIPPREQRQLYDDTYHPGKPAGYQSVNDIQGGGDGNHLYSIGDHRLWVVKMCVVKENHSTGEEQVDHDDPLHRKEVLTRILLYAE